MNSGNQTDGRHISAIFLAAGKSERFGIPKWLLAFDSTTSFLEKLLHEYVAAGIEEIVIVMNEEVIGRAAKIVDQWSNKCKIVGVLNPDPAMGRFSSIRLGAGSVEAGTAAFIQNIDNPFTNAAILVKMKAGLAPYKFVVPVCDGVRGHPVLLAPEILEDIRDAAPVNSNLRNLLLKYKAVELETGDPRLLANINTEAEYRKYFSHEKVYGNS